MESQVDRVYRAAEVKKHELRHGRKIEVTFVDREVIMGSTLNDQSDGDGFFVLPADARSNNIRGFVVSGSVRHVRFP